MASEEHSSQRWTAIVVTCASENLRGGVEEGESVYVEQETTLFY